MARVRIRVDGLNKAIEALDPSIVVGPARKLLMRSGITVTNAARKNASYDRGGLRDSITYEVDPAHMPRYVEVGSNLAYARATELGRPPGKMPPADALEAWARRKGMGEGAGYGLAIKIMRDGIEEKPYLRPALQDSVAQIQRFVNQMGRDIEREAAAAGGMG